MLDLVVLRPPHTCVEQKGQEGGLHLCEYDCTLLFIYLFFDSGNPDTHARGMPANCHVPQESRTDGRQSHPA